MHHCLSIVARKDFELVNLRFNNGASMASSVVNCANGAFRSQLLISLCLQYDKSRSMLQMRNCTNTSHLDANFYFKVNFIFPRYRSVRCFFVSIRSTCYQTSEQLPNIVYKSSLGLSSIINRKPSKRHLCPPLS